MGKTSRYRGVSWNKEKRRWQIKLKRGKHEQRHFGYYDDEEYTARLRDALVWQLRGAGDLNFDGQPPAGMCRLDIIEMLRKKGWK
jgi:hypothetical protein